ncbi:MAG: homocysteine S-methyltransferase family protein [Desulfobacteraceae bacterium]|nr:homocysteine S-methyltransferase family protein [Desulfobacteraceae bacterium]
MMTLYDVMKENDFILTEASIDEALSNSTDVDMHLRLGNALFIYDEDYKNILSDLYHSFVSLACKAEVPIILFTPTWRANRERLSEANIRMNVNRDAVTFLNDLKAEWGAWKDNIIIGGDFGCKNDTYRPEQSLSTEDAKEFHKWQTEQLAETDIDLLMAGPLPAVSEATGIALAMETTGLPYILNFVISRNGHILDGTSLRQAFEQIDAACSIPPVGYMIGCSYPSFLNAHELPDTVLSRLIACQANASSLDHSDLDESGECHTDDISDWGDRMVELNKRFGIKIMGGCCGTRLEHLRYIVDNIHSK